MILTSEKKMHSGLKEDTGISHKADLKGISHPHWPELMGNPRPKMRGETCSQMTKASRVGLQRDQGQWNSGNLRSSGVKGGINEHLVARVSRKTVSLSCLHT